jgi:hypothetical protein
MNYLATCLSIACFSLTAQHSDSLRTPPPEKTALKFNLNQDGSHYFQATFLNQTWLRYDESNPGTTQFGRNMPETFDIGLRRTRMQLFGQITNRTFVYFQFGQNNFNTAYNYASNRKIAAFFHDALCEFKVSKGNQLKIGAGLTVLNGLSRFSQPSVGTIMTMDVPVFLQYSVDQIDQFDRRLAVYARGQLKKLDYRFYLSNPWPINSNGAAPPALGPGANFVNTSAFANGKSPGVHNQVGTYCSWNFFEMETHTTPYMTGTYLGSKKVWNIAVGAVYQKNATWHTEKTTVQTDTLYNAMLHLSLESFLDLPLNKEKGTALNAMAGFYVTNYGKDYLRYNGIMNPGTASTATNMVAGNAYGNAFPMFGTGKVIYAQFGLLLPKSLLSEGQLMPYASAQLAGFTALQNNKMMVLSTGINWLLAGHRSKITLDYQNRPTYYRNASGETKSGPRRSALTLQYQITI